MRPSHASVRGDVVATTGFVQSCIPEALHAALEKRFVETGGPREPDIDHVCRRRRQQRPRHRPLASRRPVETRHRRQLRPHAEGRRGGPEQQDPGLQPAPGRDLQALSQLRVRQPGSFHPRWPPYLRRSAPGRRQGQFRHQRGSRQAGRGRGQGVAVLQGDADQRRPDPRHQRRPARQPQHGEGGADPRRAGPGHGRPQQRRRRHRPGRAPRRRGLDQGPRTSRSLASSSIALSSPTRPRCTA